MHKKLLLTTLVTLALAGCKDEHNHPMGPEVPVVPEANNHAPVIESISDTLIPAGKTSYIQVLVSDEDGDKVSFKLKESPSWMVIDNEGLITLTPDVIDDGDYSFVIEVSDGKQKVKAYASLSVVNSAPTIELISTLSLNAGKVNGTQVIAIDNEDNPITYTLSGNPKWVTISDDGFLFSNPAMGDEGEYQFSVTASDGVLSSSTNVNIFVYIPTADCPDGSCLEDNGFNNPNLPGKQVFKSSLTASGKLITGDVTCNGDQLDDGVFFVSEGIDFTCNYGSITLKNLMAPTVDAPEKVQAEEIVHSFDLDNEHITKVLQTINACAESDGICLNEFDSADISLVYQKLSDDDITNDEDAVNEYLNSLQEKDTDKVDKAPSSHVDNSIVPVVTPGTSNNLDGKFVSSTAEESLAYKPSAESKVLTISILKDDNGKPLSGISYFSPNAVGVTNEYGEFEYLWGDKISLGIDTFEFGTITGNQIDYQLSDVTKNPVKKANIQSLLARYATDKGYAIEVSDKVKQTFALYPNVINELINLNLPNGGILAGTEFLLPDEFEAQFEQGLTAIIDAELRNASSYIRQARSVFKLEDGAYVTNSLKAIFDGVNSFHVFNDNSSFYNATGYTRGMRALNMSNDAFPVMMPRADINRELPFGEKQAWTREGKPYLAMFPGIEMTEIPTVSKDNATYGFPFVTAGLLGKGKVVFMGNSMYPSILSCPENYWANGELRIDSAEQTCTTTDDLSRDKRNDYGSMKRFFANMFAWFAPQMAEGTFAVATNIEQAAAAQTNVSHGRQYDFFISPEYGFHQVRKLSKGGFTGISPTDTPILILQAYTPKTLGDGMSVRYIADLDNPNLTQDDITALIQYINEGGNVLFMDAIDGATNPEPIGRLADAVGVSLGGSNVTPTNQAFCGSSYYCQTMYPNMHVKSQYDLVVLERFPDADGKPPFTVVEGEDGKGVVQWNPPATMTKLEIPKYDLPRVDEEGQPVLDANGQQVIDSKYAHHFVKSETDKLAKIKELQAAFPGTPVCTHSYEYEFNCIEVRKGDGVVVRGNYWRADFDRYEMSPDVVTSMVKAANLGTNVTALLEHEIYYRTKGKQGTRLSTVELNQTYDNLSVWLWNDNQYYFNPEVQDELGFETVVNMLNCYTNNEHKGGTECPVDLRNTLVANGMIHGEGELVGHMNPSYPLNYMEKPLTRIMLGRSFWDHDIVVDTTEYPGRATGSGSAGSAVVETAGNAVTFSAGNNQSTGFWAPQLQEVTVTGGVRATITVMMADDLTGKPQHETRLNRPPRMQMSFAHDGSSTSFKVPYGGLITVKPHAKVEGGNTQVTFNFTGVERAAWWKDGAWKHTPESATAPIAEVDTGTFIYTTAINNVKTADLAKFSQEMNRFADAASDFYGRDEVTASGAHRRFTYEGLNEFRHRFVNDKQISIGAAHSGYPVMSSAFDAERNSIPTYAVDDWLLWHEVGHNLAAAPFSVGGSTEVTNNLLALYMQELEGRNANPEMDRIRTDIQKAPRWLSSNSGHAWAHGDAGMRLVMFGQLKIWAESKFQIDNWYTDGAKKPSIYSADEGWNMFKLMHRKARGDVQGDTGINYCSSSETGLSGGDLLMVCSSYVSGYNLRDFFITWNVGEVSSTSADGTKTYSGAISGKALSMLSKLKLPAPEQDPLKVDRLP